MGHGVNSELGRDWAWSAVTGQVGRAGGAAGDGAGPGSGLRQDPPWESPVLGPQGPHYCAAGLGRGLQLLSWRRRSPGQSARTQGPAEPAAPGRRHQEQSEPRAIVCAPPGAVRLGDPHTALRPTRALGQRRKWELRGQVPATALPRGHRPRAASTGASPPGLCGSRSLSSSWTLPPCSSPSFHLLPWHPEARANLSMPQVPGSGVTGGLESFPYRNSPPPITAAAALTGNQRTVCEKSHAGLPPARSPGPPRGGGCPGGDAGRNDPARHSPHPSPQPSL